MKSRLLPTAICIGISALGRANPPVELPVDESPAPPQGVVASTVATPYGVCAHLSRGGRQEERCRWAANAGIGAVRCDFLWSSCQKKPDEPFDFSLFDACLDAAEREGLQLLPALWHAPWPSWAKPVHEHLPEWERYVETVVGHFGDRIPAVEIWNEENINGFWSDPNPTNYLAVLKSAYAAAKRANPKVRVLFGGTAGVPCDYIGEVYALGGGDFFDEICVHPYSQPHPPEGFLDMWLEKLRALMARYGDGDKPIVVTELGWPTHDVSVNGMELRSGLALARPGQKTWNALYAATGAESGRPPHSVAESIEEALPPGSKVEACFGDRLRERLAAGGVDAVIYPMDESFPCDTFEDVFAFVKSGGTLVDLGGMPMWYRYSEAAPGSFSMAGEGDADSLRMLGRLRVGVAAWWMDGEKWPKSCRMFPTEEAAKAGYRGDPAGVEAVRFLTPSLLRPEDEWVPILFGKDKAGKDLVGAAVIRYGGDMAGSMVVSQLKNRSGGTSDETSQARYLTRALAICMAEGVRQCYWYELVSDENDPTYTEDHFGLTHADLTPKPAWCAYRHFILQRPAGSAQLPGPWHSADRDFFFPQWRRPDGTVGGVAWHLGGKKTMRCTFDSAEIVFTSYTGRKMKPAQPEPGIYLVPLGDSPVFFSGGTLTGMVEP